MKLQDKVSEIKGVGAKKAALLKNLRVETIDDLLHLMPRKYEDRREITAIMEAPEDKDVLVSRQSGNHLFQRQILGRPI